MMHKKILNSIILISFCLSLILSTYPFTSAQASTVIQSARLAGPLTAPIVTSWTVSPWVAPADGTTKVILTATVNDPDQDITGVTIDLSGLGRSSSESLYDDGIHSDVGEHDGIYGLVIRIPTGTPPGEVPLYLTATDFAGNHADMYLGIFAVLSPLTSRWPNTLPDHLGWGTSEEEWQDGTGLQWNYISQFLTWNWQDWNANYVALYVQSAWSNNEIPILTFDMLLGSGDCFGLSEMDCDFSHLQDPTIMQGYFDRVTEAARQAAGDHPAIFHIESDGSAYMQRYSLLHAGENGIVADEPRTIPARSMSPNYPDSYAGAIQHMIDIIHTHAPNVLVALHARSWATGMDVASYSDPNLDIAEIGQRTASFLISAGGPALDLILTDWKVWDAGSGYSPWWDNTNKVFPNFNRTLLWQNQIARQSNLRLILWKLPAGNMNLDNNCQRFQDNRVDYAFEHPIDLVNAGLIGVVVGGGDNCRTLASTDGENILSKGTTYYAPPSVPASFNGMAVASPGVVKLSWLANPEFDIVSYQIYIGHNPSSLTKYANVQLQTSLQMLLPSGGTWFVSVTAIDSSGQESELANPVQVQIQDAPYKVMLTTVLH